MKQLLFLVILCFGQVCLAEDVSLSDEVNLVVKTDYEKTCQYIEKHVDEIIKASHNKIIERDGDKVKLENLNNRVKLIFVVQETSEKGKYKSQLIRSIEGGLKEQKTVIVVEKDKKGARIHVKMNVSIDNPDVGPIELKIQLNKATKGIKEHLKRNL